MRKSKSPLLSKKASSFRRTKAFRVLEYLAAFDNKSGATLRAIYNCQAPVFKNNPAVEPTYNYTSFSGGLTQQIHRKRPKIARYKQNSRSKTDSNGLWRYYIVKQRS